MAVIPFDRTDPNNDRQHVPDDLVTIDSQGDEADELDPIARAARSRERHRCAAIFASPAGKRFPTIAARLAFTTTFSRSHAIALLDDLVADVPEQPLRTARPFARQRPAPGLVAAAEKPSK